MATRYSCRSATDLTDLLLFVAAPGAGNGLGGMPGMGMGTTLPIDLGTLKKSLTEGRTCVTCSFIHLNVQ